MKCKVGKRPEDLWVNTPSVIPDGMIRKCSCGKNDGSHTYGGELCVEIGFNDLSLH